VLVLINQLVLVRFIYCFGYWKLEIRPKQSKVEGPQTPRKRLFYKNLNDANV
jgi:hypothetical protein